MPLIHFEFTKPQQAGVDAPATGLLRLSLINRQPITGKIRTTEPFPVYLVDGIANVELSVTPAGYGWEAAQYIDGEEPVTEVVIIDADSVNFSDLVRVSARSLKPTAGNVDAWVAALNSLRRGLRSGVAAINSSGNVIDADGNILLDKATADTSYATPAQVGAKLDKTEAATTYGPFMVGDGGHKYRTLVGVLRNFGAPNYWQLLDDGGHRSSGIASVTTDASKIMLTYAFGASRVGTLLAVPDETMAKAGWSAGCSVEADGAFIQLGRRLTFNALISWNGAAWVSSSSDFTIDSSTFAVDGVLTLTHKTSFGIHNAQVSGRGLAARPVISVAGSPITATTLKIEFYDAAGALIKVPNANCRAYVQRTDGPGILDPRTAIDITTDPAHNIWLFGIHETVTPA